MNLARKILAGASERLALPAEVLAGVPKMELTGTGMFRIEPHSGLEEYTAERIGIRSSVGLIEVEGASLHIKVMNREHIILQGVIRSIRVVD